MCLEDKDAADAVNKFLAEELARACRFNKSHNCFTADLKACSEHLSEAIKDGLQGLDTYAKVHPRSRFDGYQSLHTLSLLHP